MKKNYFKPEAELVAVRIDTVMQSASGNINPPGTKPPFINKSNESRGEWGNVWGDK